MGTLYIVATPIGNLDDMSRRAVDILSSVNYIACEDTRTSSILLQKYEIHTPMFPFHQHNEHRKLGDLLNLLNEGNDIAVISDAGTPGISDPGFLAIRAAWQHGIPVTVIPGPSASTTALIASGLPSDRYVFEGFLPVKKGRKSRITELSREDRTVILYESPYRIVSLLEQMMPEFGEERIAALGRELTKKFEEILRMPLKDLHTELKNRDKIKGELTLVIAGKGYTE